jgi:hypothetical protein
MGYFSGSVQNILDIYGKATSRQLADGANWYHRGHEIAHVIGSGDVAKGAGILAALSPRLDWDINIAAAHSLVSDGWSKWQTRANNIKALRILAGESPLDVLGGKKVRAFYSAILNPIDPFAVAVIDRHAVAVYCGQSQTDRELVKLQNKGETEAIQEAYQEAASLAGVHVHVVQGVTWVTWREIK